MGREVFSIVLSAVINRAKFACFDRRNDTGTRKPHVLCPRSDVGGRNKKEFRGERVRIARHNLQIVPAELSNLGTGLDFQLGIE